MRDGESSPWLYFAPRSDRRPARPNSRTTRGPPVRNPQAAGKPLLGKYELILGVHEWTLRNVFRLKNAPAGSMIVVPMSGTTDKKNIDWGKAAGSLAKVVAEDKGLTKALEQLSKLHPLARAGAELALKETRKKLNKELIGANPPPPSVQEMPWAKELAEQQQQQQEQPAQQQPAAGNDPPPDNNRPTRPGDILKGILR